MHVWVEASNQDETVSVKREKSVYRDSSVQQFDMFIYKMGRVIGCNLPFIRDLGRHYCVAGRNHVLRTGQGQPIVRRFALLHIKEW